MMNISKERKRSLKTYQLSSKNDFIYYLYQLVCRCYKVLNQQDKYLAELYSYINNAQRKQVLKKSSYINVPHDDYKNFLSLLSSSETTLLNIIGDMQGSSLSYYKFRDLIYKKKKRKQLDFDLPDLDSDILNILKEFNKSRNFQNHVPESLICAEKLLIEEQNLKEIQYNPIKIVNYEYCTLEFLNDLYESYKNQTIGAYIIFDNMKADYELLIGEKLIIEDVYSIKIKGLDHLEAVKFAHELQY